jgi:hypothetical protein
MANTSGFSSLGRPESTDWEEHGAAGDVSTGRRLKYTQSVPLTAIIDEVDADTTYIGLTKPGTAESSALWRIMKIVVVGTVTSIKMADGDDLFNNIWDNRASLTYS